MKYLILLGLSLGLVACKEPEEPPLSSSGMRHATVILDKNNPCIITIQSLSRPHFGYVAQIIGCDPNQDQRLPE